MLTTTRLVKFQCPEEDVNQTGEGRWNDANCRPEESIPARIKPNRRMTNMKRPKPTLSIRSKGQAKWRRRPTCSNHGKICRKMKSPKEKTERRRRNQPKMRDPNHSWIAINNRINRIGKFLTFFILKIAHYLHIKNHSLIYNSPFSSIPIQSFIILHYSFLPFLLVYFLADKFLQGGKTGSFLVATGK